uniref:Protein Rev n=1 Tax=Simian immunodeficiency virus (isolate GB1) TaxID=11732 RepID=REV_SIVGB|nr:RecName: Full=Protein Rev; AltName: Full=Regulator of expression of viral proteins [Simian immunodeficiency virus (ISOLATE GB1)]
MSTGNVYQELIRRYLVVVKKLYEEPIPQTARQRRRRKQQLRTRRAQLRELEGRILKQILDRGPDQLCQGVTNLALAEKSESSN